MKNYILLFVVLFSFAGCKKYLEEDFRSGENTASIVSSEETFETLINACYVSLRGYYGKENMWDLTEAGTDLYTWGLDNRSKGFTTYETFTTSEEQERVGAVWRELYKALNNCNLALAKIDDVPYRAEPIKDRRRAELKFLRAHYLWLISEIWGGVHFTTEPSEEATRDANRTPLETFRNQIIQDLEDGLEALPDEATGGDYGRVTKAAAEAMLARVHLYQGNYGQASTYAQNVINNYNFQLIDNWEDVWDINNIKNDEIVWAVNYSDDPTFTNGQLTDAEGELYDTGGLIQREGGHTGHLMFEIRYENLGWGLIRDLENGRGFQRWGPTNFFIDLFDETIDERFNGSFKNTWYANRETSISTWPETIFIDGSEVAVPADKVGEKMFAIGDTAIVFYKNALPAGSRAKESVDDIFGFHPEKGYLMIDINDMYLPDGSMNDNVINRQYYFPITLKYQDPTRTGLSIPFSKRDCYVFRISEMYLIAAEAELMEGGAASALPFINTLRGARSIEGKEADMQVAASEVDIDFILDERARELATEGHRFFDLNRTGKLVERVKGHNPDAAPFIQEFHGLRFIPQIQLDAMLDGMSYQNPGY